MEKSLVSKIPITNLDNIKKSVSINELNNLGEFLCKEKQKIVIKQNISNKEPLQLILEGLVIIDTYNIRDINQIINQDNLIFEIKKQNINILGIIETKLHINNIH